MFRRVFYSFDYDNDHWRASIVRNIGAIKGQPLIVDNAWETVKRESDLAIQRWIDRQLHGRSCTIVLIGEKTATCHWVRYEIEQSWQRKKGLLGIRIHHLLDQHQQVTATGDNPFDTVRLPDGRQLSAIIKTYDPQGADSKEVYNNISKHLKTWVETAIANRHR